VISIQGEQWTYGTGNVPIFHILYDEHCRTAVLKLWHAFLFLGLGFFPLFFFFAWLPPSLFLL
jgi:hypothetical protein